MVQTLFDHLLPRRAARRRAGSTASTSCCEANGFDRAQHEQIRADLQGGPHRPGAEPPAARAPNRGRASRRRGRCHGEPLPTHLRRAGLRRAGRAARSRWSRSPAGAGSRWTQGAGVVKALHPFCKLGGQAPHVSRGPPGQEPPDRPRVRARRCRTSSPPATSRTSRSTRFLARREPNYGYPRRRSCSRPGRAVGLRLIPMARDLRFAWEETAAAAARRAGAEGAREPARAR